VQVDEIRSLTESRLLVPLSDCACARRRFAVAQLLALALPRFVAPCYCRRGCIHIFIHSWVQLKVDRQWRGLNRD